MKNFFYIIVIAVTSSLVTFYLVSRVGEQKEKTPRLSEKQRNESREILNATTKIASIATTPILNTHTSERVEGNVVENTENNSLASSIPRGSPTHRVPAIVNSRVTSSMGKKSVNNAAWITGGGFIELENPTHGAFTSVWVGDMKAYKKPDTSPNAVYVDTEDAFSAPSVNKIVWSNDKLLIMWNGYIKVENAGDYVLMAKSFREDDFASFNAGVGIDLNGKRIIEYMKGDANKTQGITSVTLVAGLNPITVFMSPIDRKNKLSLTYRKSGGLTEIPITPAMMIFDMPEE